MIVPISACFLKNIFCAKW